MRYLAENGAGAGPCRTTPTIRTPSCGGRSSNRGVPGSGGGGPDQLVFRDLPRQIPLYSVWILRTSPPTSQGKEHQGLLTYSNLRKGRLLLYRSFLRPEEPLIHITSPTFFPAQRPAPRTASRSTRTVPGARAHRQRGALETRRQRRVPALQRPADRNVFYWPARLQPGRNDIIASDDSGHQDGAVVYYRATAHTAPNPRTGRVVSELRSSNPGTPAYFINQPVARSGRSTRSSMEVLTTRSTRYAAAEGRRLDHDRSSDKPGRATELSFTVRFRRGRAGDGERRTAAMSPRSRGLLLGPPAGTENGGDKRPAPHTGAAAEPRRCGGLPHRRSGRGQADYVVMLKAGRPGRWRPRALARRSASCSAAAF